MLSDYFSEINDHGTVVPVKDLAAFPRSEQVVLGAYNIIDNVMVNHTENGVTFTVNADKSASLSGISTGDIAGHDSAHLSWNVCVSLTNLKRGRYKLIGCPASGSGSTYRLIISNTTTSAFVTDTGEGAVFDYDPNAADPWVYCYIRINSGQNMTGKVFKPMITTDLNATYADYVAPALTNSELTALTEIQTVDISTLTLAGTDTGNTYIRKCGNVVDVNIALSGVTANADDPILTLPVGFKPYKTINAPLFITGDESIKRLYVDSGVVRTPNVLSNKNIRAQFSFITS